MPIYTKKGDTGNSSLFKDKNPVPKSSPVFECLGSIDELNSYLGTVTAHTQNPQTIIRLKEIQRNLFTINAIIAGAKLRFPASYTVNLEKQIDLMDKSLPPLKNFILPGGTHLASSFHYARTLVRKAERRLVLYNQSFKVKPELIKYLNRLSDYFFTLARFTNHTLGIAEELWKES